jgi:tRNA (cmo5U34)-methyltransferase
LKRGGGFFVVEKVLGSIPEFQDITQSLYWEMKLENGLSPDEVLNKAAALRGQMFPMTVAENEALFRRVGFVRYELVYRHLQFAGWLLMK